MKFLLPNDSCMARKGEPTFFEDRKAECIQRAFLLAHGLPHGPISTLTLDCRMKVKSKLGGVLLSEK